MPDDILNFESKPLNLKTLNLNTANKLPLVYPITDRRLSGLSHTEQVEKLVAGSATIIQLREKQASPREFYEDGRKAIDIARANNVKIIINDRVDIALVLRADGVHLGQDDLPPENARKLLGDKAIIGFSTHSVEQASAAIMLPVDYIAIGPVFATTTRENPDDVIGLDGLRAVREAVGDFPLVAIGGIDARNLNSVVEAGADSAAIISALYRGPYDVGTTLSKLSNTVNHF